MPSTEPIATSRPDYELLEAIGALYETLAERTARSAGTEQTIRRWLIGHRSPPEDVASRIVLMGTAGRSGGLHAIAERQDTAPIAFPTVAPRRRVKRKTRSRPCGRRNFDW